MATDVANNPTRQQLDELDSLLQKMLAVPGTSTEDSRRPTDKPRKPVTPVAPIAPPVTAKVSAPTYSTEPVKSDPSPSAPIDSWAIDLNPLGSSSVLGDRSPLVDGHKAPFEPPRPESPGPAALLQLQTLAPVHHDPIPLARRRRAPVPVLMRPFASITEQFDETVGILGPIGRLISGSFGRTVMGLSGLLMIAGSGAYFAMLWFGWSP